MSRPSDTPQAQPAETGHRTGEPGAGAQAGLPAHVGLRRAIRSTLAGLWWERLARAFWPFATAVCLVVAALMFGAGAVLPEQARGWAGAGLSALLGFTLIAGLWRFRAPDARIAEARLDARLPGRPLSALRDVPALGGEGALWLAHRAQMAQRAAAARPVPPDAGLTRRDPYALRLTGLTALALALIFGSTAQLGQGIAALASSARPPIAARPLPSGPGWEGWAEPPAYTRRPSIYLNRLAQDATLALPEGSTISLRLYGEGLRWGQDVGEALPQSREDAPVIRVERSGQVEIGGQRLRLTVQPDEPPLAQVGPAAMRRADGRLVQEFSAEDDFGIASGEAEISLDLERVERRWGLAVEPEPREPLRLALPLPAGARTRFGGELTADLSRHPFANLPVKLRIGVEDGIAQRGEAAALQMILPGRRFFDPFAAALIEIRRDILWSLENAPRSSQVLRAMLWQPEGFVADPALGQLRAIAAALRETPDAARRDQLAEALWRIAVELEDGGLADALERMRRAQQKLSQAMRQGASPDEIQKLMDELREATRAYTEMLAQRGEDPSARFDQSPSQAISGDQIQQMMDEIQRLMNEGRMAEAQALLDQFARMMENLQVRQGEAGEGGGQGGRSGSAQERMTETLRDQQELADRAFREMQDQWFGDPGAQQEQGGEGSGQQEPGEGQGGGGAGDQDLAEAQRQLREGVAAQREMLPQRGTPQGDATAEALDRAGRAMRDAEEQLRQGQPGDALQRQAEAIEALRDGIRALGEAQSGQAAQQGQEGAAGEGEGQSDGRQSSRDPLGRALSGNGGQIASGESLADGDAGNARARDLQDEIRRRIGERERPRAERDYLDRLIDRF